MGQQYEVEVIEKTKTAPAVKLAVAVGVIAIFAIGSAMAFSLLPRKSQVAVEGTSTCIDSDAGSYSGSYGKVTVKGAATGVDMYGKQYTLNDWCAGDGKQVFEYYCTPSQDGTGKAAAQMGYNCQNGCIDGACIGAEIASCTDSQPTTDITRGGFIEGIDATNELYRFDDVCVPGSSLTNASAEMYTKQYSCTPGSPASYSETRTECASGLCTRGACVACTDTDGGRDYATQGTVKDSFDNQPPLPGPRSFTDQCIVYVNANGYQNVNSCTSADDRCSVREGFCSSNIYSIEDHLCPNGCSSGKCL